jgi:hypothetical protein
MNGWLRWRIEEKMGSSSLLVVSQVKYCPSIGCRKSGKITLQRTKEEEEAKVAFAPHSLRYSPKRRRRRVCRARETTTQILNEREIERERSFCHLSPLKSHFSQQLAPFSHLACSNTLLGRFFCYPISHPISPPSLSLFLSLSLLSQGSEFSPVVFSFSNS